MRKPFVFILLSLFFALPLSAGTEVWTGVNLMYDLNILADENHDYFSSYSEKGLEVSQINSFGLGLDVFVVPRTLGKHYVGPSLKLQILFPVGYDDSDEEETYLSHQGEFRADAYLGAQYVYMRTPRMGFLAGLGVQYSLYRVAEDNPKNDKETDVKINWLDEWSVGANLGVVTRSRRCYFELSALFLCTLSHSGSQGYQVLLKAGGGYVF